MKQGDFVWYELATTDLNAAQRFYEHAIAAWSIVPMDMPGMDYRIANVGERGVGGLMPISPEMQGQSPSWRGYVNVNDVDAMAVRVKGAGGAVHYGPDDIPEVGRFAVCADPQGAMFMIFKGAGEPPADLRPKHRARSAGTNSIPATGKQAGPSTPASLAGRRRLPSTWAAREPTRRSTSTASMPAA